MAAQLATQHKCDTPTRCARREEKLEPTPTQEILLVVAVDCRYSIRVVSRDGSWFFFGDVS